MHCEKTYPRARKRTIGSFHGDILTIVSGGTAQHDKISTFGHQTVGDGIRSPPHVDIRLSETGYGLLHMWTSDCRDGKLVKDAKDGSIKQINLDDGSKGMG